MFTTYKRWTLKDGHKEAELVAIVSDHIAPAYRLLDPDVILGLLRVDGTKSYLALQHWPSRDRWQSVLASDKFEAWYEEYLPFLENWDRIMLFEAEWETEDLSVNSEAG